MAINSLLATHSTNKWKMILNFWMKQEMNSQRKPFLQVIWHQSSLARPWLILGCRPSLKPSSSLLQNLMDTRKQTVNLSTLMIRISQVLSLKFKPTWILDTVTVSHLFVLYRVNLSVVWVSICLVLVRELNFLMSPNLWRKVVKMWPMP